MRRLVLEFSKQEMTTFESDVDLAQKVKTFEVLFYVQHTKSEVDMICRVELEPDADNIEECFRVLPADPKQLHLIERQVDGSYIVLYKHKLEGDNPFGERCGYVISREIREGLFRMTFLGSTAQMRELNRTLQRKKVRYRVVSITDGKFSSDSPLNALTERQRKVLIAAYRSGYYSLPRRITSEQLAKQLKLHKSALVAHRRKAELRLLTQVLKE